MNISLPPNVDQANSLLAEMFAAGVASVDPERVTAAAIACDTGIMRIGDRTLDLTNGRVFVVAVGKAASGMALGVSNVLGDRINAGIALSKDGVAVDEGIPGIRIAFASHPVPDERGVAVTRDILELVSDLKPDDVVIALISGGGSALLEAPRAPLHLSDIQQTTDLLLRAGAPIQDLNAVRSELSLVKGGGLRRAIGEATCVSLILSDVLGDDPSVIASGPTVPRQPNPCRALQLLNNYDLASRVPGSVLSLLRQDAENSESTSGDTAAHPQDLWQIVGDSESFVAAMQQLATQKGHRAEIVWRDREGEAQDLARAFVEVCSRMPDDVDVVLGGGEATVTVLGNGVGGRNTEFALAAAIELDREDLPWVIASLASDGDDGANERAAGGIADVGLIARARTLGLDAGSSLADNDSGTFLRCAGALFDSLPTGTNVNDVYVGIRIRGGHSERINARE